MANHVIVNLHQCHLAPSICQQARLSRDPRFDGLFYVGVLTTSIYCRPICPAVAPKEQNVRYFDSPIQAANAGLRPCLRCRPDSAPASNAWLGKQATLQQAVSLINQGALHHGGTIEALAHTLEITPRYINKLFNEYLGTSAKQYALYQQMLFAKSLLQQTSMSITEIAFASGFNSLRRFNEVFADTLKLSPTALRRNTSAQSHIEAKSLRKTQGGMSLTLSYRPPLNWEYMLSFYQLRQVEGMELVTHETYQRTVKMDDKYALIRLTKQVDKHALLLEIMPMVTTDPFPVYQLVQQVRSMLDLNADLMHIEQQLSKATLADIPLKNLFKSQLWTWQDGIRLPSTFTPFEAGIRAILGQQVSVEQGCKLLNTLVEHYGEKVTFKGQDYWLFPTPQILASASLDELKMPNTRKRALIAFADFVSKHPNCDVNDYLEVKGIGPWTVDYIRLRGARQSDVLLLTDLVIKHRLIALYQQAKIASGLKGLPDLHTKTDFNKVDEIQKLLKQVSPWGSYLTLLLWNAKD